jgi:hypothetical protein
MALLQTGRTLPKGQTNITVGNEISQRQGLANETPQLGQQTGLRVGVADNVDIGVEGLLLAGAKVTTKVALLPRESPWAVAVFGSIGAAGAFDYSSTVTTYDSSGQPSTMTYSADGIFDLEAGAVASYHGASGFVPYIGVRWANFWLLDPYVSPPSDPALSRPSLAGYGNGAFIPAIGFKVGTPHGGAYFEYQYIVPVTSDPGDGWAWTGTHLFNIVAYFCVTKCEL